MSATLREQAIALIDRYVELIDDDRLEDWVELFVEEAGYRIVPRENHDRGLPVAIILCTSKNMIRDRIVSLREANKFNLHYDRHLVSNVRAAERPDGDIDIKANYALFQTTLGGESRLFSVGRYIDRARRVGDRLLLVDKLVVCDTFAVPTLLATPL